MPELPEVETIVRDLARLLPGRTIKGVEVLRPDLIEGDTPDGFAGKLRGRKIRSVVRRAKNIVMDLGGDRLLVNLGMTGRLLVARTGDEDATHLGARLALDRGRELRYHDVRRFGRLWTLTDGAWTAWDGELGVEPLSDDFTVDWLRGAAARSRVAVKTWLMDQARVVGVGNIYASEGLFRAGVDPRRPADTLSEAELARVRDGVRQVLAEAIEHRGTTFLDYRDARGEEGAFAARLKVYDREGQPCDVCGGTVQRLVQGGRSTFFCPSCQH
ncbi:MAG TPA: bifunctional DNA-formamidopyrimidine glycosylase/DNA-(apurinic or apyrimidinic site) lyase [Longimicrobium sp.]|jgi:formamidopyrimidine-DNA glycosylase|uniref:bifunctional DNA-formamidopyrimidine glycosylase/DNA-(apurinic or apyrimidinic site) lyase n=1 Tax=Longimicrobium sp. TaxID=2029185 RepID=UPI002ED97546